MKKGFTIGYGGRAPQQFLQLLQQHNIRTLVDVRLKPDRAAMGSYVRAKKPDKGIQNLLAQGGIQYKSLVELGNRFLDWEDWRTPYQHDLYFSGPLVTKRLTAIEPPWCLMCAEKKVTDCHREYIAKYLKDSWDFTHI